MAEDGEEAHGPDTSARRRCGDILESPKPDAPRRHFIIDLIATRPGTEDKKTTSSTLTHQSCRLFLLR